MSKIDERIVFGIADSSDGKPTLLLGISRHCWETMQNGLCKDLDLTGIGLPIRLLVFGGDDHDGVMKTLYQSFAEAGVPILDERRRDFSIKENSNEPE